MNEGDISLEAILINNLTKIYRNGKKALDHLSMTVKEGEIFTLLGQNGAGKSTLINTLTTYLTPTSGSVKVFGKDLCHEAAFVRKQIACVAQKISIDNHLTLMENMLFQGRLYQLDKATAAERIDELIHVFALEDFSDHRVTTYSGGMKRRLDIAMSMISRPKLLFLDEPTVALDIESRKAVWEIIEKIRKDYGTTVFMTTHYLEEAEHLSDTICILKDGHELVQDTPENLRRYTRQKLLQITLTNPADIKPLERLVSKQPFVSAIHFKDRIMILTVNDKEHDLVSINKLLIDYAISYCSIGMIEPSLEHVFLTLTQGESKGA
jgi:ABC-2 type transport system ATP-binding protein